MPKKLSAAELAFQSIKDHPVALAVAPVKAEAVAKAAQRAQERIDAVGLALGAVDWDAGKYAPYPKSNVSRLDYTAKINLYRFVREITTFDSLRSPSGGRRMNDPEYVIPSIEGMARYIDQCKETAAAQYDAFAYKLVKKVGSHVVGATLEGSHVWGYSLLRVKKVEPCGRHRYEHWKTQEIENVSVLGNYFPQWPTRLVK
jgi:hypothetical protein